MWYTLIFISRQYLTLFSDFNSLSFIRDDLYLQDRHSQSVQPAHQPDHPRLIDVHGDHGDCFYMPGLINADLGRTFEALQPFHIDSTPHLNAVVCGWIEYWLSVSHLTPSFCRSRHS
jgi:hypothetical protein